MKPTPAALLALTALTTLSMVSTPAQSAEVQFEGWYRARGRAFDSLSLQRDLANAEGFTTYAQHRFWLKPRFVINEHAAVFAEFRGLDGVLWGDEPGTNFDAVTNGNTSTVFNDELGAPGVSLTTGDQASELGLDFTLWRVWAEVHTPIGRFKVGRVPLHWGLGVWQNDGTRDDDGYKDFGDTSDRLSWEHLFVDQVYVSLSVGINSEGYLNLNDDTTSVNLAAAYRSERLVVGVNGQWRTRPIDEINLGTISLAFDVELGALSVSLEGVAQFGAGTFAEVANQEVLAGGAVLQLELETDIIDAHVDFGFASGDASPADEVYGTFAFDRDFNIGLFMFEQPMPVLSTNGTGSGRSYDAALSGNSISNAIFLKPQISKELIEGVDVSASVLLAWAAVPPTDNEARTDYGTEFNVGLRYEPLENVHIAGTFGAFLPGNWYSEYETEVYNFTDPAFGVQLETAVSF